MLLDACSFHPRSKHGKESERFNLQTGMLLSFLQSRCPTGPTKGDSGPNTHHGPTQFAMSTPVPITSPKLPRRQQTRPSLLLPLHGGTGEEEEPVPCSWHWQEGEAVGLQLAGNSNGRGNSQSFWSL